MNPLIVDFRILEYCEPVRFPNLSSGREKGRGMEPRPTQFIRYDVRKLSLPSVNFLVH